MRFIDTHLIYVDRLNGGEQEELSFEFPQENLGIDDPELRVVTPVKVDGYAQIVDEELVMQLSFDTTVEIPCRVCNDWTPHQVFLQELYRCIPMEQIKKGVFDLTDMIREDILVEVPQLIECVGGCPQREELEKYFVSEKKRETGETGCQHPFADFSFPS